MTTNGIHLNLPLELSNPPGPPQMPSQSWATNSHSTSIYVQSASAMSMSNPFSSPDSSM